MLGMASSGGMDRWIAAAPDPEQACTSLAHLGLTDEPSCGGQLAHACLSGQCTDHCTCLKLHLLDT